MRMTLSTSFEHTLTANTLRTWAQAWLDKLATFLPVEDARTPRLVNVTISIASPDDRHETITPDDPRPAAGIAPATLSDFTPPPKATAPRELQADLHRAGWTVSSRAWPDFFATTPDGAICLVTAKRNRGRKLRAHQLTLFQALSAFGVPCYRWSKDYGFERIGLASPSTAVNQPKLLSKMTTTGTIGGCISG